MIRSPRCTYGGCFARAVVMLEERVSPWKWERRWRCVTHEDSGEVREMAGKTEAIRAIEAAARWQTAPVAAAVEAVEVAQVEPVVEVAPSRPVPEKGRRDPKLPRGRKPRKGRAARSTPRKVAVKVERAAKVAAAVRKPDTERPAARLRAEIDGVLDELRAGVSVADLARRYGRRERWVREQLHRIGPPGLVEVMHGRAVEARRRGQARMMAERAALPLGPGRRIGAPRKEEGVYYEAGKAALWAGAGIKRAAGIAGLSVNAMRGRLITDGLWPARGQVKR